MERLVIIDDYGKERSAYMGIWLFGGIAFVVGVALGMLTGSWLTLMF